jgi:predicted transcriptional regulator
VIVRDALVADPRVLPADASAREAAELLTHPHVQSALVADGDRLVGCVTSETIVRALAEGMDLGAASARDVASPEVATVAPDVPLEDALRLMGETDVERLAVVEDGRLLGVLPREPLLRRLAEDEPPPTEAQQQV